MDATASTLPFDVFDLGGDRIRRQIEPQRGVHRVEINSLLPGDSPRVGDEDAEHIQLLAAVESDLPPILVHRPSLRVIDGMHRLQAAIARGVASIEVEFYDGTEEDAFLEAVRRNVAHGKPLTRSERESAALRLLKTHHSHSDRSLAEVCGLSPKTVGALRSRVHGEVSYLDKRLGRDGKLRPVDPSSRRWEAARVFQERPEATTRQVAQEIGIAQATAADVRDRIQRGEPPCPRRARPQGGVEKSRPARPAAEDTGPPLAIADIAEDRALQSTDAGQAFLEWFSDRAIDVHEWNPYVESIPVSRAYLVARAARQFAREWQAFAEALEKRPLQR